MTQNLSQLKANIHTKLNLQDSVIEDFIKVAYGSFLELENDINITNPHESLEKLSVLSCAKDYFTSEEKWDYLLFCCLKNIQKGIYDYTFHSFSAFSGVTYIAFVVNHLSTMVPNLKRFLQSINTLLVKNLSTYINSTSRNELRSSKDYERINGFSGPLRYLLEISDKNCVNDVTLDLVKALIERSYPKDILGYFVPGWHYNPPIWERKIMDMDASNGCIDYGVAHGMCGPLSILSLAYKNGIRVTGLLETIENIIAEYLKAFYHINHIIYWPGKITFEQYIHQDEIQHVPQRMSWCYGSIGILRTLYMASVSISNKEIERFAVEELIKIAQMDLSMLYLSSSIVCHGFSGLAVIMNEMYKDTNNPVFLEKTLEIARHIIYDFTYKDAEHCLNGTEEKIRTYNYLEGYSGILQTIFYLVNDTLNGNERCLLIV